MGYASGCIECGCWVVWGSYQDPFKAWLAKEGHVSGFVNDYSGFALESKNTRHNSQMFCGYVLQHPRKLVTHNYRQLSSNLLLLWVQVAHYYG